MRFVCCGVIPANLNVCIDEEESEQKTQLEFSPRNKSWIKLIHYILGLRHDSTDMPQRQALCDFRPMSVRTEQTPYGPQCLIGQYSCPYC